MRNRKSLRLHDFDYSTAGLYFITICIFNKECLLGEVAENKVELYAVGKIVEANWYDIPKHSSNVQLDAFVVMPNHIHGMLHITENLCRGVTCNAPT